MRVIEVITDQGHVDTIRGIAEQKEIVDIWVGHTDEDGRCSTRMLVCPEKQQAVIDAVQALLATAENTRRTWYEQQKAKQSMIIFVLFWFVVLIILIMTVKVRQEFLLSS